MTNWLWIENPAFVGKQPRPLDATCHDRSPFVTIRCSCDFDNHVHESSIVEVPPHMPVMSRCNGCGSPMTFRPGELQAMFADLRRLGWII